MGDAAVNKTTTTLNPAPARPEATRQEQWEELRSVFPIYVALAKQLEIAIPIPQDKRNLPEKPPLELFKQVQNWLDGLDSRVLVHQLRHLLQQTTLNASESGLRALIQRHLRKPAKTNTDRDKIDFLLVQYFALCAPAKIYHKQIELADTAVVMKPVLGETDTAPLAWCEPLEKMITSLRSFRSLRDMLRTLRAEGRCILFSSHVMQEVAALCDRVVIIGHGRVLAEGTPEAIREQSGAQSLEEAFLQVLGTPTGVG